MNAQQTTEKHARTLQNVLIRLQTAATEWPQRPDVSWGHAEQMHDALQWAVYAAALPGRDPLRNNARLFWGRRFDATC